MEVSYDADVDILSIVLASKAAKESKEVLPGIVVDFDSEDRVIAFEIFDASNLTDLAQVNVAIAQPTRTKQAE